MNDKKPIFAEGIRFSAPNERLKEKAPWIKGHISIRRAELEDFMQKYTKEDGWINLDLKKSKEKGTLYLELNTYQFTKKEETGEKTVNIDEEIKPEDLPFN